MHCRSGLATLFARYQQTPDWQRIALCAGARLAFQYPSTGGPGYRGKPHDGWCALLALLQTPAVEGRSGPLRIRSGLRRRGKAAAQN